MLLLLSQGQACYAPLNDICREWGRVQYDNDIRNTIYEKEEVSYVQDREDAYNHS